MPGRTFDITLLSHLESKRVNFHVRRSIRLQSPGLQWFAMLLVVIVFGSIVAVLVPDIVLLAKPVLKPAFAVTMLFVGLLVDKSQLQQFVRAPIRPMLGLAVQYTVMPLLAASVALFHDDPAVRAGVIIVGCMPGAMASNVMTLLVAGDLMLSIMMTTLATLVAPLVVAFWLPLLSSAKMELPTAALATDAALLVAIPVAVGIIARQLWRRPPDRLDWVAKIVASLAIAVIIAVVVAANADRFRQATLVVVLSMLLLNIAAYGIAHVAGRLLRWPPAQRRTLMIEVSMQNAGLGSVLALSHLGPAGALPSAIYTVLCVATAAVASMLLGRQRNDGATGATTTEVKDG